MTRGEFTHALTTIRSAVHLATAATQDTATLGQVLELLRYARVMRDEVLPLLAATAPAHIIDRLECAFSDAIGHLEDAATDIRRKTLPLGEIDAMREGEAEALAEQVYRLAEFRKYVESNVLFPTVSDAIVKPMRENLRAAENAIVVRLYNEGEFERIAKIHKTLLAKVP